MSDKLETYYFFENEKGGFLNEGSRKSDTSRYDKAAYLTNKFEAEVFCSTMKGYKVVEIFRINDEWFDIRTSWGAGKYLEFHKCDAERFVKEGLERIKTFGNYHKDNRDKEI